MSTFTSVTSALLAFRDARDWAQFHNPKDLAAALSVESGELLELYLWKDPDEADEGKVADELADVISFALLLAHHYDLDPATIVPTTARSWATRSGFGRSPRRPGRRRAGSSRTPTGPS